METDLIYLRPISESSVQEASAEPTKKEEVAHTTKSQDPLMKENSPEVRTAMGLIRIGLKRSCNETKAIKMLKSLGIDDQLIYAIERSPKDCAAAIEGIKGFSENKIQNAMLVSNTFALESELANPNLSIIPNNIRQFPTLHSQEN